MMHRKPDSSVQNKRYKSSRDRERNVKGMRLSGTISIGEECWIHLHDHYIHPN